MPSEPDGGPMKNTGAVGAGAAGGAVGVVAGILSAENLANLTSLEKVGPSALLVLVVLLVLFGVLVPAKAVRDARKEADYWREAFFRSTGQVDRLVDKHDIGIATMKSLEAKAEAQLEGRE